MKEGLKHTITVILIVTLCGVSILIVKNLDFAESKSNRQITLGSYLNSYVGKNISDKYTIHKHAKFPVIKHITVSPNAILTADKQMVAISLDVAAEPMTGWKIVRVEKNEPEYGMDEDHDGPDAIFVEQMLKLRAERNRAGDTRTYTIYLRVYNVKPDGSQDSTIATVEVEVPGSQSNDEKFATYYE